MIVLTRKEGFCHADRIAWETLSKLLRGRIAALRGARSLAYLFDMYRSLRSARLALHPAHRLFRLFHAGWQAQSPRRAAYLLAFIVHTTASAPISAETIFPPRSKTLLSTAPAECREWTPPLPLVRHAIELNRGDGAVEGSARLTIRISADGRFAAIESAVTNDARFVTAAVDSLERWTFQPARCNGDAVGATATVWLEFRRGPAVTVVR